MPRLTAEALQGMTDEDYKKLSPDDLARVNNTMPLIDYEHPYTPQDHPYPKTLYSMTPTAEGGKKLRSARVNDARSEKELRESSDAEWKNSVAAWGIETHPGAPDTVVEEYAIEFRPGEEARVVAAGS